MIYSQLRYKRKSFPLFSSTLSFLPPMAVHLANSYSQPRLVKTNTMIFNLRSPKKEQVSLWSRGDKMVLLPVCPKKCAMDSGKLGNVIITAQQW